MNTILCPVDYSLASEQAIEVACRLATPSKTKILVLTVTDPAKDEGELTMADAFTKNARSKILDQILEDQEIAVEHLNLRGDPAETIVNVAVTKQVDAIVMGTHGRTGWAKVFMGSVAQEVMKKSHCPVIIVRPKWET